MRSPGSLSKLFDQRDPVLGQIEYIHYLDTKPVPNLHHFAVGDGLAIDLQVHRGFAVLVELEHHPRSNCQDSIYWHGPLRKQDGHGNLNLE